MDQVVAWLPSLRVKCQDSIAASFRDVIGRLIYVRVEPKGCRTMELQIIPVGLLVGLVAGSLLYNFS